MLVELITKFEIKAIELFSQFLELAFKFLKIVEPVALLLLQSFYREKFKQSRSWELLEFGRQ